MDEALEAWRPLFDRAVRLAMRADVPVGILLSGGMDSSLIAESAVRQGRLNRAFFLDFEDRRVERAPRGGGGGGVAWASPWRR